MQKKKIKYPFCILMLICVLIFWVTILMMGYKVKLDGTLVKYKAETEKPSVKQIEEPVEPDSVREPEGSEGAEKSEEETKFVPVEMEYLDGALFIGDSRTSILYEYAGWDKTHFFVEYGQTIWDVMDRTVTSDKAAGKVSVRQALKNQQYDKIYIMLGVNELGRGTADTFYEQYKSVVDEIRQLQPDAIIFVQSILHVSAEKDNQGSYINNKEIYARNEKIKNLADSKNVFWLDENEVFDEEGTGKLNPEYTSDGVHIKAKYISVWKDFLLSHGIESSQ